MRKRLLAGAIMFFSSFLACLGQGAATWMVPASMTAEATIENRPVVCYIQGTSNYYVTVEKGLNAATSGQTVMVIPGTNPTITSNCTIKSGVTLRLPYDESASDSMTATSQVKTVVDSTSTGVKLTVTVASGVTLTNNGTLQISGILSGSSGGGAAAGQTVTSWANLCLDSNATYVQTTTNSSSPAITYCYGFITEKTLNNGSQCVFNSGTVYMPFILRDFRGGSVYAGMQKQKSNKCFLFNDYEMKNIEPIANYYYQSSLIGMANLYANESQNATQMTMIGTASSAFLQLTVSGSYIAAKYNKTTQIATVDFYGGLTTNSMSLSTAGVTVSSSDYFFGIGYRHVLSFNKLSSQSACTYTIGQDYKFLPGTSLTVGEGSVLNASGHSLVFYAVFNDVSVGGGPYPSGKPAAYLTNNGTVTAGSLAGYVKSGRSGAVLTVQTSSAITTYEVNGSSGSSFLTTCTFQTISNVLTFDKYDSATSLFVSGSKTINVPAGAYTSETDANSFSGYKYVVSGDVYYVLSISLDGASVVIKLDGATTGTTYSSSSSVQVKENASVNYTVSYSNSSSQTTNVTLPDGSSSTNTTGTFLMTANATIAASSSSCLVEGTLITMADGSQKPVEEIKAGDSLRAFNHETGAIENSSVVFNDSEKSSERTIINCEFSNGFNIKISSEHGFFNQEENKYVYLTESNYSNYIGKHFVTFDAMNEKQVLVLNNAYLTKEECRVYSPVTEKTLNYFTDGVLSMPGGISGLFNIFDYDSATLEYDQAKKETDIAKYGLLTLDDFGGAISQYMFDCFNGQYLGVAVGKGLLTWDDIARLAATYAPLC